MDESTWRVAVNLEEACQGGVNRNGTDVGGKVTFSKTHCLFCAKEVPALVTVINGKVTKIKEEGGGASGEGLGDDGCIEGQLRCMFILLNILDVGGELCSKLLGKWGSRLEPHLWFNVCDSCKVDVYDSFQTVVLIRKLERKLNGIKNKLKSKIVGSAHGLEWDAGPFGILKEIRLKVIEDLREPEDEEPEPPSGFEISVDEAEPGTPPLPMVYPQPQPGPSSSSKSNVNNSIKKEKKVLYKCELCSALVSRKVEYVRSHQNLHLALGDCRGETCNLCGWLVGSMGHHIRNWHSGTTPLDMSTVIIKPLSHHDSQQENGFKEVKDGDDRKPSQLALAKLYPTQTPSAYSHKCMDCGELLKTRKRLLSHMEEVHGKVKIEQEDQNGEPIPSTSSFCLGSPKKYDPISVLKLEFSSPAKSSVRSSPYRFDSDRENSQSPVRPFSTKQPKRFSPHKRGNSSSQRSRHMIMNKKQKPGLSSSSTTGGYTIKQIGKRRFYSCLLCPAKFPSSLIRVKRHLNLHKKGGGGVPCNLCGEFIHQNTIAHHQKLYCSKSSHSFSNMASPSQFTSTSASPRSHSQRGPKSSSSSKGKAGPKSARTKSGTSLYHECGECGSLISSKFGKAAIRIHQRFHNDPDYASKVYNCEECGWLVANSRAQMHNRRWHPPSGGNPLVRMSFTTKTFEVESLGNPSPKKKLYFPPSASNSTSTSSSQVKVESNSSLASTSKGRNLLRECGECGALNLSKSRLELHKDLHRSKEGIKCPDCGWLVKPSNGSMENHRRYHHNREGGKITAKPKSICIPENVPFYCDYCPMIYPDVTQFIYHFTQSHKLEVGFIQCELCEMPVESKQLLRLHIKTSHPEEAEEEEEDGEEGDQFEGILQCQHCPEVFESKAQLDLHMANNHPTNLLHCFPCGIGFSAFPFYKRHNLTFHPNGVSTNDIGAVAKTPSTHSRSDDDVDGNQGRKRARESRELRVAKRPRLDLNGEEQEEHKLVKNVTDSPGKRRSTRVNGMDKGSIED